MINLQIGAHGSKWWYRKTYLHRTNGPAVMWYDGYRLWYINDQMLTEYEYMFMNEIDYD